MRCPTLCACSSMAGTPPRRTPPGAGSRCSVIRPQGVSRSMSHWSRGVQISGVRFWNLTASQPASAATSIKREGIRRGRRCG